MQVKLVKFLESSNAILTKREKETKNKNEKRKGEQKNGTELHN
jgi:hypothetical protein